MADGIDRPGPVIRSPKVSPGKLTFVPPDKLRQSQAHDGRQIVPIPPPSRNVRLSWKLLCLSERTGLGAEQFK
jgi:hypothetical protein